MAEYSKEQRKIDNRTTANISPSKQLKRIEDNRALSEVHNLLRDNYGTIIQREVFEYKEDDELKGYYTDLNPSYFYPTEADAEDYEASIALPVAPCEGQRPPTLYTYTHTKPSNVLIANQGPHTLGYAAIGKAFSDDQRSLVDIFHEQCPSPQIWRNMVLYEKSISIIEERGFSQRLLRAYKDYFALYRETASCIASGDAVNSRKYILRLMQLHPYATYAWKTKTPCSHSSSAGGGENSNIMDDRNIDEGGIRYWKDVEAASNYISLRRRLAHTP